MDGYVLARARDAQDTAENWKAFAEQLQRELKAVTANLEGNRAVKEAALKELARVDPKNFLLVQQNRQRIYDASYDAVQSGRRAA